MRVTVFDHQDRFVKTIGPSQILGFVHRDELNGEDSVSITTTEELKQGYRLVWQDRNGKFHEHICQDPQAMREYGCPIYSDSAVNSIYETSMDRIDDKRPFSESFAVALQAALGPTRWSVGTVDKTGAVSDGMRFYRTTSRESINMILECGGELETEIEVTGGRVSGRAVGIRQHRGSSSGHRRFTYRKDLISISKTEHWGAITACYGYGASLETDAGGYTPKLTFGDINDGKDYVEDSEALEAWGRPDGKGGLAHLFGSFEDSECDDKAVLKKETTEYLDVHKVPGVTYEASVADLVAMGRSWEGVGVGDDVQIVDEEFTPTLRCSGRVTRLETDYTGGTCDVTLGNVTETMADMWQQQQSQINGLINGSGNWNAASNVTTSYLEQVISRLNERFNVMGASYTFTSFEQGTIWASVPMDENGSPTQAGGFAIQICSQGFRIASGTKPDGSFDWKTFGTGGGFTADMIVAGTLNAALVRAGILTDAQGNNFWNLDSGEFRLSMSTGIGGGSQTIGKTVVDVDIQYGLSDSATEYPATWTTTALWQQGRHMWSRQKRVLADGSVEFSTPKRIANANGIGGVATTEQYYLSTSEQEPTGGQWLNSQPKWVSGRYYWTRNRTQWSDGTVTYDEPALAGALTHANQATDDLDSELDVVGIFNRLTDNGRLQGIYMTNGDIFINGTYIKSGTILADLIKAGTIKDATGKNKWDMSTGDMTLSGNLTVNGGKIMDSSGRNVWDLAEDSLDFANPDSTIRAGIIQGAGGNYWNLNTGAMALDFVPDNMATTSQISSLKTSINSVSGRVTTAQNRANSAYSLASTASSNASSAKSKTDKITFTTSGMQIYGTNGQRQSVATYTSEGFTVDAETCIIGSSSGSLTVKDWGMDGEFQNGVRIWVTDGSRYGGGHHFYVCGNDYSLLVNKDGVYHNGRQLAYA